MSVQLDFRFDNPVPGPIYDRTESQRLIDEYVRKHGVTRCPVAFAAVTLNAQVDAADLAAHADRSQPKMRAGRKPTTKWQAQAKANSMFTSRTTQTGRKVAALTPAILLEIRRLRDVERLSFPKIGEKVGMSAGSANNAYLKLKNGGFADLVPTP